MRGGDVPVAPPASSRACRARYSFALFGYESQNYGLQVAPIHSLGHKVCESRASTLVREPQADELRFSTPSERFGVWRRRSIPYPRPKGHEFWICAQFNHVILMEHLDDTGCPSSVEKEESIMRCDTPTNFVQILEHTRVELDAEHMTYRSTMKTVPSIPLFSQVPSYFFPLPPSGSCACV